MEMEHPQQLQYIVCRRCGAATTELCYEKSGACASFETSHRPLVRNLPKKEDRKMKNNVPKFEK